MTRIAREMYSYPRVPLSTESLPSRESPEGRAGAAASKSEAIELESCAAEAAQLCTGRWREGCAAVLQ